MKSSKSPIKSFKQSSPTPTPALKVTPLSAKSIDIPFEKIVCGKVSKVNDNIYLITSGGGGGF